MDEPIKNYPEYPLTLRALCWMAVFLALVSAAGIGLYRMVEGGSAKVAVQRNDPNFGTMKRFERMPSAPDRVGLQ